MKGIKTLDVGKLSLKIATKIGHRLNKSQEEISILNYGLFIILHTGITILVTVLVGILTKTLKEIMIICICSAILKRYSGGVHASSPTRCTAIGVIMSTILAIIAKWIAVNLSYFNILFVLSIGIIVCYYVLYKRSPVGSEQKPLKKESKRKLMRKKSFNVMNIYTLSILVLIILNSIFNYKLFNTICISIVFGALVQIFTISIWGGKILVYIDSILSRRHIENYSNK